MGSTVLTTALTTITYTLFVLLLKTTTVVVLEKLTLFLLNGKLHDEICAEQMVKTH